MKKDLVCICIPNYNNEKTISETLDSLLNQTYKNIIIKVLDNASTDNSMEILRRYEKEYSNIQVFQHDKNIGGEANFTKCFEYGEGRYTAVFHSDDVYEKNIIEEQVAFLEKNNTCVAVSTHSDYINEEGIKIGEHFVPPEIKGLSTYKFDFIELFKLSLKYGNFITCPSVMSKTKIIQEKIKFWNFEEYKTSADFDVWLRLAKEGCFGFINKPLIKYRMSVYSYSYNNNRISTNMFDMFLVFESYLKDKKLKSLLSVEDFDNYNFQYAKANLSVNINRYLLGHKEYISFRKTKFKNTKGKLLNFLVILFSIIKFFPLPLNIKKLLLNKKVKV